MEKLVTVIRVVGNLFTKMSHPSDSQQNTETGKMQQNAQSDVLPPIYKVHNDCWLKIFDWISIEDVHAFGQTCTKFYRLAGVYFNWKYQGFEVNTESISIEPHGMKWKGFEEFAARLGVGAWGTRESLLYALDNCKSIRELNIEGIELDMLNNEQFEKWLSKIEILYFNSAFIPEWFFESLLEQCVNLKRLTVTEIRGTDWMNDKYPKLQHLGFKEIVPSQDIRILEFIKQNPSIRSISIDVNILRRCQTMLIENNIQLNDLTIKYSKYEHGSISTMLIDLHQRGIYKRLHIHTESSEVLTALPGLATLNYTGPINYFRLLTLPTVTELRFRDTQLPNRYIIEKISRNWINLKRVFMFEYIKGYLTSFIRNSVKLEEIEIDLFMVGHSDIDLLDLNEKRKKLIGAKKVIIYFDEWSFLELKWKYGKSDFGLIEIRRSQSLIKLYSLWGRTM